MVSWLMRRSLIKDIEIILWWGRWSFYFRFRLLLEILIMRRSLSKQRVGRSWSFMARISKDIHFWYLLLLVCLWWRLLIETVGSTRHSWSLILMALWLWRRVISVLIISRLLLLVSKTIIWIVLIIKHFRNWFITSCTFFEYPLNILENILTHLMSIRK